MSGQDDGKIPAIPPTAAIPFEAALGELEGILRSLEDGSASLEESLTRYERGMALVRHCLTRLQDAEQRIRLLTGITEDGKPNHVPFEHAPATAEKPRTKPTIASIRAAQRPGENPQEN